MKVIKIDECFQCQHCFKASNEELYCEKTEKIIMDGYKIPKWCPLEDYKP